MDFIRRKERQGLTPETILEMLKVYGEAEEKRITETFEKNI